MKNTKVMGRPSNTKKIAMQRKKLLDAAELLLNQYSYTEITIRDIAIKAELNSAMIKYYFNNKEGLFIALLEQLAVEHFALFDIAHNEERPVLIFIKHIVAMLNKNPGIFRLFTSEALNNDDSSLANIFLDTFPKKISQYLPLLIQKETGIENMQTAKLAAFHLSSVLISPLLLRTARLKVWEISDEVFDSKQWVEYVYQNFLFGFTNSNLIKEGIQK